MDRVLILDTETTALTPEDGQCIEVAAIRYSLEARACEECLSMVLQAEGNPAEHINHIPPALLSDGKTEMEAWDKIAQLAEGCEAILAHNAEFDRQWVPDLDTQVFEETPWICTCHGVDWPKQSAPSSSLINLALDHGLGVVDPHRALNDCLLLARLLTRCAELGHDVEAILAKGLRPTGRFEACVSFARKDLAKDAGFKWQATSKQWTRTMALADVEELQFRVLRLDG